MFIITICDFSFNSALRFCTVSIVVFQVINDIKCALFLIRFVGFMMFEVIDHHIDVLRLKEMSIKMVEISGKM